MNARFRRLKSAWLLMAMLLISFGLGTNAAAYDSTANTANELDVSDIVIAAQGESPGSEAVDRSEVPICNETQMKACNKCYQQQKDNPYCCAIGGGCLKTNNPAYTPCNNPGNEGNLCKIPPVPETKNCTDTQMDNCSVCQDQGNTYCCAADRGCNNSNNPTYTSCGEYENRNEFCKVVPYDPNMKYNHTVTFENKCTYPIWVGLAGGSGDRKLCPGTKDVFCTGCQCCPDKSCCPSNSSCPNVKCGANECLGSVPQIEGGGFQLGRSGSKDENKTIYFPKKWSGTIWGRTNCLYSDGDDPVGPCDTGNCKSSLDGNNHLKCGGAEAEKPFTKIEFNFDGEAGNKTDDFDVSLVDGYNLPVQITPKDGTYVSCTTDASHFPKCAANLSYMQGLLKVRPGYKNLLYNNSSKQAVGILSTLNYFENLYPKWKDNKTLADIDLQLGCGAAGEPYTSWPNCDGNTSCKDKCHSGPPALCSRCDPTTWPKEIYGKQLPNSAEVFKEACPNAYSYAYDELCDGKTCPPDKRVLFQCTSRPPAKITNYTITFCPDCNLV